MLSLKKICAISMLMACSLQATAPAGYTEQKLIMNDGTGDVQGFGAAVAVVPDGKTFVVGAPGDDYNVGAIALFKLQQNGFHQNGPKIVAQNLIGSEPVFGFSVSISANGTRIAAGAPWDTDKMGAVFIFDYNSQKSIWEQTAKIVSTNVIGNGVEQGTNVALSADGSTLVFSGPGDNNRVGSAWVYIYNGIAWTEQAKLVGSNAIGQAEQGSAIAISSDGNTVALGACTDENGIGGAYIFTNNGSNWIQVGDKLRCTDITDAARLGESLTLSSDGTSLLVGAPYNNKRYGAVCRFMKLGSQWIQEGNSFRGTDSSTNEEAQGYSLALSGNKQVLIVGAPLDTNSIGAFYPFNQIDAGFQQQGNKITVDGALPRSTALVGASTAISANGETFVVGGPDDNFQKGAVWAYYKPAESSPESNFFDTTGGQILEWVGGAVGAAIIGYLVEKYILEKICHLKCPKCSCCKNQNPANEPFLDIPVAEISTHHASLNSDFMNIDEKA